MKNLRDIIIVFILIGVLSFVGGLKVSKQIILDDFDKKAEEICQTLSWPAETGWFDEKIMRITCQNIETFHLIDW